MKLVICGAGQTGRMVGEFVRRQPRLECVGYLDDDDALHGRIFYDLPVLGGTGMLAGLRARGVEAGLPVLGAARVRLRLFRTLRELGYVVPSIVDPSANLCSDVELGEGAVVSLGTNILTNVKIGRYAMIGTGVTIGHDIAIGANCVIGGATVIGASTTIGDNFNAGTGVVIGAGRKTIGNNVFLCAGAVVLKDVPDNAVVLGNPGRVVRFQEPVEDSLP